MIGSQNIGKGFRGCLNYLLREGEEKQHGRDRQPHAIEPPERGAARDFNDTVLDLHPRDLVRSAAAELERGGRAQDAEISRLLPVDARDRAARHVDLRRAEPSAAEIIGGNMGGRNARELAREFGNGRTLNTDLERAVYHVSLSVRDHERLSNAQWQDVAQKYLRGMGFDPTHNQYVLIRHNDTPNHDHVHIVANRIRMDNGKTVSDSRNYDRSADVIKGLEREYRLTNDARRPHEVKERAITREQGRNLERTGEIPIKTQLQEIVKEAARDKPTMSLFLDRLKAAGVDVRCNVQSTGRVAGISYELDGVAVKGSQLGKNYSWDGLQKEFGVRYEQSRDLERCRQASERKKAPEPDRADERTRGGGRDDGREHGEAQRGDPRDLGRDREHDRGRESEAEREPGRVHDGPERADGQSRGMEDDAGRSREKACAEPARDHDLDMAGHDRIGDLSRSVDRVADLALVGQVEDRDSERLRSRDESGNRGNQQELQHHGKDRTAEAVQAQLRAFGCDRYDVGIRDEQTSRMMNRTWSREEAEKAVPWLKRMNAIDNHIYVRPAELDHEHAPAIVLVDDLKREAILEMKRDGLEPSLVVETSRGNYQAWVRVRETEAPPLSRAEANETARTLAERYRGDLNSADCRHYGRLAGFTNRKEKHTREDGFKPFVKLVEAVQRVASKGAELLERVRDRLAEREKARRAEHIRTCEPPRDWRQRPSPAEEYRRQAKDILKNPPLKQDRTIDYSRVDYQAALGMLGRGYNKEEVKGALRDASPELASRKAGHLEDYLERTVAKAMEERAIPLSRDRGLNRDRGGMER